MIHLAGGLLALAAVLVCIARRTAGRPPLWRSRAALAGSILCLAASAVLVIIDPRALGETPVLIIAALCMFEGGMALISLRAAAAMSGTGRRLV